MKCECRLRHSLRHSAVLSCSNQLPAVRCGVVSSSLTCSEGAAVEMATACDLARGRRPSAAPRLRQTAAA